MTIVSMPTTRPPTVEDLPQLLDTALEDPVAERQLDRQLRRALSRLRDQRSVRRARSAQNARREHERHFERALLVAGLHHVR